MFAAEKEGEYEAIKIRRREKPAQATTGATDADEAAKPEKEDEPEWEEDRISEDGAIWPIKDGRIVDWQCFYALMTHVYNTINPPFHTPVMVIAEAVWTPKEHEKVTQFFFEKFKIPAFSLVDSATAACYAYGIASATVVEVGLNKADITCISDFVIHDVGRSPAVSGCGGEAMTERLMELLHGRKGFTRDVCEQLKKSSICEILPADISLPTADATNGNGTGNPAAAASTGVDGAAPGARKQSIHGDKPRGSGPDTQVGEEKMLENEDGVLDIASIITGGNMSEYLAQKEREKAERLASKQKKGSDAHALGARKPVVLPNYKRTRNTFLYEDMALHDAMKKAGHSNAEMADMQIAMDEGPNKRQKTPEPGSAISDKAPDSALTAAPGVEAASPSGGFRREIEVGLERFQAGSSGILDRLADAIYRTIQACPQVNKRSELWDSLIILGNGSKVRGFKEALLETLQRKYIISPSSATIFTSELPSTFSTPMATGANTPQPGQLHHGPGGVNPLLMAATTGQNSLLQPGSLGPPQANFHSSHAQTPTSVKVAKMPEYFSEWKEVGYDEATFLGAQVAARVLFVVDANQSKGYMTRTDYNEQGPAGVHEVYL